MASLQVLILSLGIILAVQGGRMPVRRTIAARIPLVPPKHDSRIVGGSYAMDGQFPYQVAIFVDSSKFCGGSLISDEWILTAGQCVSGAKKFTVMMGSTSINQEDVPGRVVMNAFEGIAHESYAPTNHVNDIGLVKLPARVTFGATINKVHMPIFDAEPGQSATVTGWGAVKTGGVVSERLKFLPMKIMTNPDCVKYYPAVRDYNICASATTSGICTGDAGGALVLDGSQVGIASYITGDCKSYPSVFTRVTYYRDWITENSGI